MRRSAPSSSDLWPPGSGFQIIGHRGAAGLRPENTLESFREAVRWGCRAVELDVHCAASGELIVIHDPTVDRTTTGSGRVDAMSLRQIRHLRTPGGQTIPTLADVLQTLQQTAAMPFVVNIELKGHGTGSATAHHLATQATPLNLIVSSFDWTELSEFVEAASFLGIHVPTALLMDRWQTRWHEAAQRLGVRAVNLSKRIVTAKRVAAIKGAGYQVFVYTVNTPQSAARMRRLGADGIFTDRPDLFLKAKTRPPTALTRRLLKKARVPPPAD